MAKVFPRAEFAPLEPQQTRPAMQAHDIVCVHTMAAPFAVVDAGWRQLGFEAKFAHFGLTGSGRLVQYQDLGFRSRANADGNHRCITIETADRAESFPDWKGSDVPHWTDAQLDTLVDLIGWLCDEFDIPKELVPDSKPGRRGIAYHRLGIEHFTGKSDAPGGPWLIIPGGERWSRTISKVCPGDRRIDQLVKVVVPRVQGATPSTGSPEEIDMTPEELREIIRDEVTHVLDAQARRVAGITSWERYLEVLLQEARKDASGVH